MRDEDVYTAANRATNNPKVTNRLSAMMFWQLVGWLEVYLDSGELDKEDLKDYVIKLLETMNLEASFNA